MLKQKLALALVLVMMFLTPGVCFAILPITEAMIQAKEELTASGKMSNEYLDHTVIDLTSITSGSVATYTYSGDDEHLTINNYDVSPNEKLQASNKITTFIFNLTMQYRPDTEMSVSSVTYEQTVHTYTYGALKHEAMLSVLSGLPDCLNNEALNRSDSDSSWTNKYTPDAMAEEVFSSFKIGEEVYTATDGTTKTMDVAPEINDGRTFVPVRYLAYSLGVTEEGIQWDATTQSATIAQDDIAVTMAIGDSTLVANGELQEMDTIPYLKDGRTMLPARWVAEPLGATVEWDEVTQQTTIKFTQEVE